MSSAERKENEMLATVAGIECEMFMVEDTGDATAVEVQACRRPNHRSKQIVASLRLPKLLLSR